MSDPRVERMMKALEAQLAPTQLDVKDDSAHHAGHAGAAQHGGGHFTVFIVSSEFDGKSTLQRHQMVYQALGSLMQTDIHALIIRASTPSETLSFHDKQD